MADSKQAHGGLLLLLGGLVSAEYSLRLVQLGLGSLEDIVMMVDQLMVNEVA